MFMPMLSGGNVLPLASSILPFRPQFMNHLSWGNFPWEHFLLHLTPIAFPHILTPSLVYVLLMCIALSLHLHVDLQWPIPTESLRDSIAGITVMQMLLVLHLDPLCRYRASDVMSAWLTLQASQRNCPCLTELSGGACEPTLASTQTHLQGWSIANQWPIAGF